MSKKKQKYYVVWVGAEPGIYSSWPEAYKQVHGFPSARHKSFPTLAQAKAAFGNSPASGSSRASKVASKVVEEPSLPLKLLSPEVIKPSLSVDAACSGNPGKMEYQGVNTATRDRIFHQAFPLGTNNIGEFLGIIHGLAWCKAQQLEKLPIYTDSKIAMGWIARKKCKTTVKRSAKTEELLQLIARGEQWLKDNSYNNPILKWDTKRWGEIPADFGRK